MGTAVHAQPLAAHMVPNPFHYRADVLLRLFDPFHLGEIRNSRGPAEGVLVFDLPDGLESKEQVSEGNNGGSIKTHSRNPPKKNQTGGRIKPH